VFKEEAVEGEAVVREALPSAMFRVDRDNQILAGAPSHLSGAMRAYIKKNGGMVFAVLAVGVFMASCVGVRADAVIQANGSGTITLEYSVSQPLDTMGKLDGNERWRTVPVGEADFRRTVELLDGVELVSFASKTNAARQTAAQSATAAVVNTVKLKFDAIDSLLGFLDATGERASFAAENGKNKLSLVLAPKSGGVDPDLLALFASVSSGYTCAVTVSVPSEGSLSVRDADGSPLVIPDAEVRQGDPLSFSVPIGTLLSIKEGVVLEIIWG
jgi:translation initiation factor IF-1